MAHVGILIAIVFALAACGSNPSPEPVADSAPTAKQRTAKTPNESVPQAIPIEEPLPAEAVQKFDTAVVRMNAGDDAAAEQAFRTIAADYPKYSGALVNLGILQANQGRLEDAEKSFQAALQRNASNAAALNQLGIVYRKLGRFQDADQSYQRAVQADPNYANAYLNLGVLCDLYLQQPERALEAYERYLAVAASPDERVKTWVTELRKRLGAEPRAARSE
jgi:tetratricopeptide (TPR) repeat protein